MKVTLLDVLPLIWRRFQVPTDSTLHRLHAVLQEVMGWQDSHLHQFLVGEELFGKPYDGPPEDLKDSRQVTLRDLLSRGVNAFTYEYDFGDSWEHVIEVQKVVPGTKTNQSPLCLSGERACPPENSGGPPGYEDILAAMNDREHEEHDDILGWLPRGFDPELFDLETVNAALRALRSRAHEWPAG